MYRDTIDFGIDLGTTNSSIALWGSSGQVEVFKNSQGSQSTPSAVYEGRRGRLLVGAEAKEQMKIDPASVHSEFKQQMGRPTDYVFPESGNTMRPEDLSAEVIKALKGDVQRRLNEEVRAAVITIPAAFEKAEIYATNRAAELAGFVSSPLCLEPVAAALAYGHQNSSKDGFWLVFDFGGGTFDAAIVQLKDEEFQVVNHQGDNFLGGKLIDWAILDQILIPAVQSEFKRKDFSRQNDDPAIKTAISKLKLAAEKAKIELSTAPSGWIVVDNLLIGADGKPLFFEFELLRGAVDKMAMPYIVRAINLCRQALSEKRLAPQDMERLILVGGPTQMPVFREMLADPKEGLGIPLEFSVDPMTVVAQGAAIFARTHRLPKPQGALVARQGEVMVEFEYEPAGADDEPVVAGRLVMEEGESPSGFSVEFRKADWRSGRIRVSPEGKFLTQLVAERGENVYTVEVVDGTGAVRKSMPQTISYLRKAMFREIPLSHSFAVARADNSVDPLFEKGMPLPLRKTKMYTQTVAVSKEDPESAIRIPLVEGSNDLADRNIFVGALEIKNTEVVRDVPAGSEVEFTLSIDTSNRLTATAYLPVLDQEFEKAILLERPEVDKERVAKAARAELTRHAEIEQKVHEINDDKAKMVLERIKAERRGDEVENALGLIDKGGDAHDLLLNRLRDLRRGNDELAAAIEWPELAEQAKKKKGEAEKVVKELSCADQNDKDALRRLGEEQEHALRAGDAGALKRVNAALDGLYFDVVNKDPGFWVAMLTQLKSLESSMNNPSLAQELFKQGDRAITNNDVDGIKIAVKQLFGLLPSDEAKKIGGALGSTVM